MKANVQRFKDDHLPITSDSVQYLIVRQRNRFLREQGIKVTLEAREISLQDLEASYRMVARALSEQPHQEFHTMEHAAK